MPGIASNTRTSLAAAAELYAALGWAVVPLHEVDASGRCSCGRNCENSRGKHPRLNEWQDLATDDVDQVRAWWRQWPNANIGARCGSKSGFIAIDVDPPGGEQALIEHSGGDLPATVESRTGKGRRLFYAITEACTTEPKTRGFKDDGADGKKQESIRLQGGNTGAQCVLPPSMHYLGHRYTWAPGHGPEDIAMAPMPSWVWVEMCRSDKAPPPADTRANRDDSSPWSEFNREDSWDFWLKQWGYTPAGGRGEVRYYTRPGKTAGVSASVGHVRASDGTPALWVFSGNCPELEPDKSYDLAGAYSRIMHRGDFSAAGKSLFSLGYGKKKVVHLEGRVAGLERRIGELESVIRKLTAHG